MRAPTGLVLVVVLTAGLAPTGGRTPSAAATPLRAAGPYVAPVPGALIRPFAPPATPFGPGHRGVDLAAAAGETVRAAGAGTVVFVGEVAGRRWVTVDHPQGVRTSYGVLAEVGVAVGETVERGDPLGTVGPPPHVGAGPVLHWSARLGETYIDPMDLLAPWRASLVGPGGWRVGDLPDLPSYRPWDGEHRWGLVPSSPEARGPGWSLPPNVNTVIGVAGLGSRTGEPPFDLTHLGYPPEDVSYLSYAPDGGPYRPQDTWRGIDAAARRLGEDLREAWALEPGRAVDLVGHSMGGVVALHYLLHHHDPLDPELPPIGNVVTIASPLGGADLARALVDGAQDPVGRLLLETVARMVPDHDPTSPAIRDLAVGSDVLTALSDQWDEAARAPHRSPLATGTRVLTLGGQVDLVVPEHRSDLDGAPHVVLPGTHDGVRRTEAVRIAVREFLAGRPTPGEPGGLGHWVSYPVGWFERLIVGGLLPG